MIKLNIPHRRLLIYILILGLIPLALAGQRQLSQHSKLRAAASVITSLHDRATFNEGRQARNKAIRQHYRNADHFYIDKHLETLVFLKSEQETLQKITTQTDAIITDNVAKRLELLTKGNRFIFSEGAVQSYPTFQETLETLSHPVEINTEDLQEILAKVEGVQVGNHTPASNRPLLIITDFRLERKNVSDNHETFLLNLKLLKREFL